MKTLFLTFDNSHILLSFRLQNCVSTYTLQLYTNPHDISVSFNTIRNRNLELK